MKHISKLIILLAFVVSSNAWGYSRDYEVQRYGWTPLMRLIAERPDYENAPDNIKQIQDLINTGVDINAQDNLGYTALMHALNYNRQAIIVLIKNGADVNIKNKLGATVLTMVAHKGNLELARMILSAKSQHHIRVTSLKNINNRGILLNWYTNSNPILFKIEYSKDYINWVSQTVVGTSRSFYLHNVEFKNRWESYTFRIKAKTKHGWSDYIYSNSIRIAR